MELQIVPNSVTDAQGRPNFGTYRGELPSVDLIRLKGAYRPDALRRVIRRKRWQFSAVATEEVLFATAIVHAGFAANAFTYAVDLRSEHLLFDHSFIALPDALLKVNDRPSHGHEASFTTPGAKMWSRRTPGRHPFEIGLDIGRARALRTGEIHGRACIETDDQAPALTVIAPVDQGGFVNVTQKWAGLPTGGALTVGAKIYSLDGGIAGLDYTQGYLARRTAWRWCLALGRLPDGRPVGINLVEGFNENVPEANENAMWIGDELIPLSRARFVYQKDDPSAPWTVRTLDGLVDLRFRALHVHFENRDLKVLKSYFVQPAGLFEGTIKVEGKAIALTNLAGMMEDQEVYW